MSLELTVLWRFIFESNKVSKRFYTPCLFIDTTGRKAVVFKNQRVCLIFIIVMMSSWTLNVCPQLYKLHVMMKHLQSEDKANQEPAREWLCLIAYFFSSFIKTILGFLSFLYVKDSAIIFNQLNRLTFAALDKQCKLRRVISDLDISQHLGWTIIYTCNLITKFVIITNHNYKFNFFAINYTMNYNCN